MSVADELLSEFRKAAKIEHRLLAIEHWLQTSPHLGAEARVRRWRMTTLRALTLIVNNQRLQPLQPTIMGYFRAVFDRQLLDSNSCTGGVNVDTCTNLPAIHFPSSLVTVTNTALGASS